MVDSTSQREGIFSYVLNQSFKSSEKVTQSCVNANVTIGLMVKLLTEIFKHSIIIIIIIAINYIKHLLVVTHNSKASDTSCTFNVYHNLMR